MCVIITSRLMIHWYLRFLVSLSLPPTHNNMSHHFFFFFFKRESLLDPITLHIKKHMSIQIQLRNIMKVLHLNFTFKVSKRRVINFNEKQ